MDVDPPVPPSSASKKVSKSAKKPKFTPKPPVKRKSALVLPKNETSDADSETEQELLREVIERLRPRVSKVEKKSSDNAITGSSKSQEPPKKDNDSISKKNSNLKEASGKNVMFSSSTATKVENFDYMLVDDESESSSNSDNEYKEPWAPYSYYPITLPLRPPGSGDPEILNAEEFLKHDEYDETKVNSSLELGLQGSGDDDEKRIILFQFPNQLPFNQVAGSLKGKEKVGSSSSLQESASNKHNGLQDLPNGCMGKMLVYKSGVIKLKLGDTIFDVSSGTPCGTDRSVAMMNTKSKNCCVLGKVDTRATVTPDLNSLLDNIN